MSSETPPAPPAGDAGRPTAPAALITGCSSGIGHATALRLHAASFTVYATAAATYPVRGLEGSCAAIGSPHADGGPRHLKTDRFSFRRNRVILAA
jgi:NAD(P)-dependent dehydrogenase (short-subunit alcohol dehydrogenase family)